MKRLPDRPSLYRLLPPGGIGAEIGVYRGDNASDLLYYARPARLHLVDPWPEAMLWDGKPSGENGSRLYLDVCQRFALPMAHGQVLVHRQTLSEAALWIPPHSLDWVYLDADHQHSVTMIEHCLRLLRPGGLLAGHDYLPRRDRNWDVFEAVGELVASNRARLIGKTTEPFPSFLLSLTPNP